MKTTSINIITIFLLLLGINQIALACVDCLEAEINGSACTDCPPDGWRILQGLPGMCDGSTCSVTCSTASHDGGGVAVLKSNGTPIFDDAIDKTISGLTPGVSYAIGFDFAQCGTGALRIDIDGFRHYFEGGSDYERAIICFIAEDVDVEIVLMARAPLASDVTLMVDYLSCSELINGRDPVEDCEAFSLEVSDGGVVCPGEDFDISAVISPSAGTVNARWECDPPEGLDYLDDPNALEPIFNFPDEGNSAEQFFTYTVYVDKGGCEEIRELEIIVTPSIDPEFGPLYLCASDDMSDLPPVTTNRYTGSWDGPSPLIHYAGEDITVTFHLHPDQNNCAGPLELEVFVDTFVYVEFFLELEYCSTDSSEIVFPDISDNAVFGEWTIEEFTPSDMGPGYFYNSFIPDIFENPCSQPYEVEIRIIDTEPIGFELPEVFCAGEEFTFPRFDTSGIRGRWETRMITTDVLPGVYENRFEPIGADCDDYYIHQYRVVDFELAPIVIDPTGCTSLDGYIEFNDMLNLEFSIDSGRTWQTEGVFSDLTADTYQIIYRYNIEEACPDTIEVTLYGTESPSISEVLVFDDTDCTIDNGEARVIGGVIGEYEYSIDEGLTWTEDERFSTLSGGDYILMVRYIDDPACFSAYPFVIRDVGLPVIQSAIAEDISDCNAEDGVISIVATGNELEYSIDGGLTFSASSVFEDLGVGTYPVVVQGLGENCTASDEVMIFGPELPMVNLSSQSPTSCVLDDGTIIMDSDRLGELEFSIDNGLTWQEEEEFLGLGAGGYSILYRLIDSPECNDELSTVLTSPDLPEVEDIIISDNTSCSSPNGRIEIIISQMDIEYSIDGGTSWSSSPDFENLEGGIYDVHVRLISNTDCVFAQSVSVEEFELPVIDNIMVSAVSDCGADDGSIIVDALGTDLRYMLEGITSWQNSNTFENLSSGDYLVLVTIDESIDCTVSQMVNIGGVSPPDINVTTIIDATACSINNGQVSLESTFIPASEIEFSIDGVTWQDVGDFDDLAVGDFMAYVRLKASPSCLSETSFSIEMEPEELTGLNVLGFDPSDCDLEDGVIEVNGTHSMMLALEYSIDNINWQSDNIFSDLPEGIYTCYVRVADSPLCTYEETIELIAPDCPCLDYMLSAESNPVLCELELGSIEVQLNMDETILWDDGSTEFSRTDLNSGWYSFTIIYQDGRCIYEDSIFVDEIDRIEFLLESFPSDCEGDDNGFVEIVDISGGDGTYNYSLDGTVYQGQSGFYDLSPGQYELFITDDTGCQSNEQFVIDLASEEIEAVLPASLSILEEEVITLNPLINETTIDSFVWSPTDYLADPSQLIAEAQPTENITYTLTIYYGDGCTHTRTIDIRIIGKEERLYLANIIDPTDSQNTVFFINTRSNFRGTINSMTIYDRWGNKVFHKDTPEVNNPSDGWDPNGTYRVGQGVYTFLISYDDLKGKSQMEVGTVTIIK